MVLVWLRLSCERLHPPCLMFICCGAFNMPLLLPIMYEENLPLIRHYRLCEHAMLFGRRLFPI